MNARQKLNQSYATGSFLVAGYLGLVAQSVVVFIVALIILLSLNVASREIR